MLLTNDLTDIGSEKSKIRLILWMAGTCNVKVLEEVEKNGRKWMYFASLTKIVRYEQFWKTTPVSLKPFSRW